MKFIGIFLCFISALLADANPFSLDQNLSIVKPAAFERQDFKFDSNARILKSITLNYISLDGTQNSINVDINKSIDWHDKYILLVSKTPQPSKILDLSVTIPEKNESKQESSKNINIEPPLQAGKIYDFIAYSIYNKKIKFSTDDELITDFSVGNPSKIVLDFKAKNTKLTKSISLKNASVFKRIDFGSHKGYYRLVIYLDGKYNYAVQKDLNGYLINLF